MHELVGFRSSTVIGEIDGYRAIDQSACSTLVRVAYGLTICRSTPASRSTLLHPLRAALFSINSVVLFLSPAY